MYFGADYYPEHWAEERWETDLVQMKKMNFSMVRVAEFAWCRLEPTDGVYDFAWLDRFLDLCGKHDIKVMMGVPARVVPAWLWKKDPSMAIQAYDGNLETFGTRYTTCISNPLLLASLHRLAEKMAERYKNDPRVVSWHLDNEYGDASPCYCENCRQDFIRWLQAKYGTLDNLNKTWGLIFWSMELTDWDQVWLPQKSNHFQKHPSLLQDYYRFNSWKTENLIRSQAAVFRRVTPGLPITTNIQSSSRDHSDYVKTSEPLDVVSTNYYPLSKYSTVDLDICRGLKNQNFWVVEQKSGSPGSQTNSYFTSVPGEVRMFTYQSIAHGADMMLYYRWRPSNFSNEQFYMGIQNYDGSENRVCREIDQVGKEFAAVMPEIEGTTIHNDLALMFSYDSRWADKSYKPNADLDYRTHFLGIYQELERQHFGMDIVNPESDLSSYKTVVIPYLYLADEAIVENIARYVEQGGTAIVTPRCGAKDEYARMTPTHLPARLMEVFGIHVEEVLSMKPGTSHSIVLQDSAVYATELWSELLIPTTAATLARYGTDWFKGYAAVTGNRFGKGYACYIGTLPENSFYQHVAGAMIRSAGVQPLAQGSPAVQATRRSSPSADYLFLINAAGETSYVSIRSEGQDMLAGEAVLQEISLKPYDVKIIKSVK